MLLLLLLAGSVNVHGICWSMLLLLLLGWGVLLLLLLLQPQGALAVSVEGHSWQLAVVNSPVRGGHVMVECVSSAYCLMHL
jgi:hypothetical protein